MKKKLISLAVLGVLAPLAASMTAMAADTTVYGHGHVSWDYDKNDANPSTSGKDAQSFISDNSSRIGVKVNQDLGGGMKAIAQWETTMRVDNTGSTNLADRNSFVGMSSDAAGTLKLGNHDTPMKDVGRIADFFNEQVGDARSVIGAGNGTATTSFDQRTKNMVRYESPTWAGVNFAALYSGGEGVDNTRLGSANMRWAGAGAKVGLAYEVHAAGVPVTGENETGIRLAGTYGIAGVTIGALYETLKDLKGVAGRDRTAMGIGARYDIGNNGIKAQYYKADKVDGQVTENGGSVWALGYEYKFAKNVVGYVDYANATNDSGTNAFLAAGSAGSGHGDKLAAVAGGLNGEKNNSLSVGMIFDF